MRNRLSALHFQDKIFIAYGFVFLVMFGAVFGSTSFLIHLAFKREIGAYVETRQAQISNNYQAFLNQVQKDVHAAAADERLHRAIEKPSFPYQPISEFDLFEYGTPDGKLLYPDPQMRRNAPIYRSLDNREAHIEFRRIPQRSDLGQQFVVQVTAAGEWGFVTGGYNLQTWLEEKETIIQSDEHPVFLVRKPPMPEPTAFDSESGEMTAEDWLPLNNAARRVPFDGWLQSFSRTQPQQKVVIPGSEETDGSPFTAYLIKPFNSAFAMTREAAPVGLIVAYSHARQMRWQQQLTLTLLLSGVGGLVLVYLISYIVSRSIARPIAVLREGVSHIAAGDLNHRVNIESGNEMRQLADGFNQMARDLKRGLDARMAAERAATWRDVARQVAHEIKNPLFPIRLSVENLQQAKSQPEVFENIFSECTDTVIEEVDRIGKLIDEFHQFARMPRAQRKPNHLNDIIKSVLTLYTGGRVPDSDQADSDTAADSEHEKDSIDGIWLENISKIKVETELEKIPKLLLDPEQITQALGNLLKNAIEAMPDGGTLKVTTYFTPSTPYGNSEDLQNGDNEAKEDEDTDPNGIVTLEIQDTGCGMSDETMANLFVPYYTTKSETEGTGLGIPIVRRIVEEHGAEIEFESTEDVGTTVRIYFSYNRNERAEELALGPEGLIPLTGLTPKLETQDRSIEPPE